MKCRYCKRPISTGDAKRSCTWYRTPGGAEYMFCAPEGTLLPPLGSKILRTAHYKCWQASRTGEQTGQRVSGAPGAYEIDRLMEAGTKLTLTVDQRRVSYLESQGFTHDEALAYVAQQDQAKVNEVDPEHVEREPSDWRDQDTMDV